LDSRRRIAAWTIVTCTGAAMHSTSAANEAAFSSRDDAEAFLARALPLATAGNPKYYSKADKAETRWLTKSIEFHDGPPGRGVQVSTDEEFTEVRAGVATPGTHQAVFSLGDVHISMETSDSDVTAADEPALGILFKCAAPHCIQAKWSGSASLADWTDIYLQDATLRGRIFAAFEFLAAGDPKAP
jgi:hypothetical protein